MSGSAFTVPIDDRYFEDYAVGSVHEFGAIAVEEAEVIAFARRFDPQFFHVDPETARKSAFGGLIASGWHTAALAMRMWCDAYLLDTASLGSPGIEKLKWTKPVRPGDTLRIRATVLAGETDNQLLATGYYLAATWIGVSRLIQDHHWASDVVLGAAIGGLSGWSVRQTYAEKSAQTMTVVPVAMAHGAGVAVVGQWR